MSVTLMLLQPTYSLGAEHLVYLICKCRSPLQTLLIAPATHHRANDALFVAISHTSTQPIGSILIEVVRQMPHERTARLHLHQPRQERVSPCERTI